MFMYYIMVMGEYKNDMKVRVQGIIKHISME